MYSMYLCTVDKTDRAILKIANEITKIPGTVKKLLSFLQKSSFLVTKVSSFLEVLARVF